MNQGANERGEVKNGLKRLSQDRRRARESERERERASKCHSDGEL